MFLDHPPPTEALGRFPVHACDDISKKTPAASDAPLAQPDPDGDAQEERTGALARNAEPAGRLQAELDSADPARAQQLQAALVLSLLEAVHEPVFVLSAQGALEQANGVGRSWLRTDDGHEAVTALQVALRVGAAAQGFVLTRIEAPGLPAHHWLARWTLDSGLLTSVKMERAQRAWGLGERSMRVLQQVASGRSNKEIAAALGRSEVTVERHLTQLFRRAGCQSRAELIARLYAL